MKSDFRGSNVGVDNGDKSRRMWREFHIWEYSSHDGG